MVRCSLYIACLVTLFSLGCGKSPPAPPVVRPITPAPAAGSAPSAVAAAPAGGNQLRTSSGTSGSGTGKSASSGRGSVKPNPLLKDADPQSIFEISELPTIELEEKPTLRPEDQFTLAAGVAGVDSSQLKVVTVAPAPPQRTMKKGFVVPKGFKMDAKGGYSEDGLPLRIINDKTESVLTLVPAGVSRVGTPDGPADSRPEFSVYLDAFYMEVFEVSIRDFEKYRENMRENKKAVPPFTNPNADPRMPMLGVPFSAVNAYFRWAEMEMPTEAEWERAARGLEGYRAPWGNSRAVWPSVRTSATITIGGSFSGDLSPFGIYDLAGNAREWCSDIYSDKAHQDAVASSSQIPRNWSGPKRGPNGNLRVVKGNSSDWLAAYREGRDMTKAQPDVGFRGVVRIPESKN